ncbi:hypothetical protein [Candidatus Methylomicrobium oryzae]|jgi:hypothetical protein|uniref:hypothetical protein n=1 Tax=Candidatus Methylomicrobium oryzae TaxID=2802053 RepID=UPI001923D152|nr:hypothetical protein [Methylomicrobium sp. RS1]MBL1262688.1 hypothetical protein [Methylomicrobium sp. RS1]
MIRHLLICILLVCATPAQSEEITLWDKAVDIGFFRPTGFLATLLGAGAFAAMSPMAAVATVFPPHDSISAFAETLVIKPAEFTFTRPVGAPVVRWLAVPPAR